MNRPGWHVCANRAKHISGGGAYISRAVGGLLRQNDRDILSGGLRISEKEPLHLVTTFAF
jgi:hypothetical protein